MTGIFFFSGECYVFRRSYTHIHPKCSAASASNSVAHSRKPVTSCLPCLVWYETSDQEKVWTPRVVCKTCRESLRRWTKDKKWSLRCGICMVGENRRTIPLTLLPRTIFKKREKYYLNSWK